MGMVRLLLVVAASHDGNSIRWIFIMFFLHGDLDEEVYRQLSPSYKQVFFYYKSLTVS